MLFDENLGLTIASVDYCLKLQFELVFSDRLLIFSALFFLIEPIFFSIFSSSSFLTSSPGYWNNGSEK